jgi:hypothetical protein
MKSGNLHFLELSGPIQACNGTALTALYYFKVYAREIKNIKAFVRVKILLVRMYYI